MRVLRWILLALYLTLILGLFGLGMAGGDGLAVAILYGVALAGTTVLIVGSGHKDLCRPVYRPRLVGPVVAAAFMMSVLVGGLTMGLSELFMVKGTDSSLPFLGLLAASWVFWAILLYVYTRRLDRYGATFRLAKLVFAGSLAELLAAIPSHLIVERRSGCFVGLATAIGICAGIGVMLWSFGPGIFLLFLEEARRQREKERLRPDRAGPGRRGRFQFQIRTMLLITLAVSVIASLLKTFWGHWFAAAFAGTLVLFLLCMALMRQSALLILAGLTVLVGLFWFFWGEWTIIGLLVIPVGVLMAGLLWFFAWRERHD